jgi:hypothetical protein
MYSIAKKNREVTLFCDLLRQVVQELVCDIEEGAVLTGTVTEIREYGVILEVVIYISTDFHFETLNYSYDYSKRYFEGGLDFCTCQKLATAYEDRLQSASSVKA